MSDKFTPEGVESFLRSGLPAEVFSACDQDEIEMAIVANDKIWSERIALLASCLATNPDQAENIARVIANHDGGAFLRQVVEKRMAQGD